MSVIPLEEVFERQIDPLKDRLKLDNCVTRAMQDVMKLVRIAGNRHLRNWEAPDALVQEIIPERVKQTWAKLRYSVVICGSR